MLAADVAMAVTVASYVGLRLRFELPRSFLRTATPALAASRAALSRGEDELAERIVAGIGGGTGRSLVARSTRLVRAEIALARRDVGSAAAHCDAALGRDDGVTARALATRALANALAGRSDEARVDAESALGSAWCNVDAAARAHLAIAMVTPSAAERTRYLDEHRREIVAGATLAERAMLRETEADPRQATAYRAPGRAALDVNTLALWEATRPRGGRSAPRSIEAARNALVQSRAAVSGAGRRRVALTVVCIVAIGAACFSLEALGIRAYVVMTTALLFVSWYVREIRRSRNEIELLRRERCMAPEAITEERRALRKMADTAAAEQRMRARRRLALLDEESGEPSNAIVHVELAIAEARAVAASRHDGSLAMLVADRVRLLAALGRTAEAEAELEILETSFAPATRPPEASLRARVALALAARNLEALAALGRERRPSMRLPEEEDTLLDLATGATGGGGSSALHRLDGALARDRRLRGRLDALAPGLRVAVFGESPEDALIDERDERDEVDDDADAAAPSRAFAQDSR